MKGCRSYPLRSMAISIIPIHTSNSQGCRATSHTKWDTTNQSGRVGSQMGQLLYEEALIITNIIQPALIHLHIILKTEILNFNLRINFTYLLLLHIKTIRMHHLHPGFHKIQYKFLFRIILRI
jgi:hypothetical protein